MAAATDETYSVKVTINNYTVDLLVDSGATTSIIDVDTAKKANLGDYPVKRTQTFGTANGNINVPIMC